MADVVRSNGVFGGRRAVLRALEAILPEFAGNRPLTLLDVGTGAADIPRAVRKLAQARGVQLQTIGLDLASSLAGMAGEGVDMFVCGDALRLPLADDSVDLVTCSQLLHHFSHDDGVTLLSELDRVAKRWVLVSELRRSRLAASGFWLASFPLRFHPITRHDGRLSVLRGFVPTELRELVMLATGRRPLVRRALGWRLTASWVPASAAGELG